jgi:periplasmic protein CpxP/Spy
MKTSINRVLIGAVASGLTTLFIAAFSWSTPHGDTEDHSPERMVIHMAKMLDLTDEQQAIIEPLLSSTLEESRADAERLHVLRDELRSQRQAFDATSAQVAADQIGQITSRLAYRMASTQAEIYQLLDDEQKVALTEMEEWREKRHGKRRGHYRMTF